jgi:hypothetical protein
MAADIPRRTTRPFTAPLRSSGEADVGAASTSGEVRNEVLRKAAGLAPIVVVAESAQTAMIETTRTGLQCLAHVL